MNELKNTVDKLGVLATELAERVFRTDLERPGFAHLNLGRSAGESERFQQWLKDLARELGEVYRREYGQLLGCHSQGRFDQQVTTGAHRDGGPDESVLVLGYEPTTVASRLLLLDFSRAARDRGLEPAEFLARFNPIFPAGREVLEGYVTELADFDPAYAHVVIINNGNRPWADRGTGMLGVLHQAIILRRDPSARRIVHSLMLSPVG
jgi:hypothetical protein